MDVDCGLMFRNHAGMDSISALLAFVRTAEAGSIVGAARVLGLSASAVGKRIARLEQDLGTRLFHRTTRRVHLTDEGDLLLQRCRPRAQWAAAHRAADHRLSLPAAGAARFPAALSAGAAGTGFQ
ncbi:hypothetical protein G6F65_019668 [Rhizopus arrhizus]|nr:hypothetical protein G6F68_016577 [Rhizopus microsporus]KAG1248347.1 hypothetical protein G6F65_019668 [Rhizopus arrhizus]